MRYLKLRYSVLEKSIPEISGKSICEIEHLRLRASEKKEILHDKVKIELHEAFFSSFIEGGSHSEAVRRSFGSEASFIYMLECLCREYSGVGFIAISKGRGGEIVYTVGEDMTEFVLKYGILLAVDLWEHAYFDDYGFDRNKYLSESIPRLNFARLDRISEKD